MDLNDFDEAYPGAWEWDLRRLVTSVWVAGRHNGCPEHACEEAAARCVAMCRFARGYAEQTERDYQALLAAVARGVLHAEAGQ